MKGIKFIYSKLSFALVTSFHQFVPSIGYSNREYMDMLLASEAYGGNA